MSEWYMEGRVVLGNARSVVIDGPSRVAGGYRVRVTIRSDFDRPKLPNVGMGQQHRVVPVLLSAVALAGEKTGELALPQFIGSSSFLFEDGVRLLDAEAKFETVLSREAIDDIERFRDGGDLRLRYVVHFDHFATVARSMSHCGRWKHSWVAEVDTTKWTKHLTAAGYHEEFLTSVPLRRGDMSVVGRAHEYLLSACEQRDIGHLRDAIVHCRLALESISPLKLAADASDNAKRAVNALRDLQNKESDTLSDRFSILHAGLMVVASVGAHANNNSKDVTRDDVNALLTSVSALLGLVPSRLQRADA